MRFLCVQAYAEPGGAHDLAVDEAFERLYRSYGRDVYRYTLALLRNPADAEDITQTTFLNAYRAYLRGEEPRLPRHWLIKIAHNACRTRHLRAVRRPQEVPFEETVAAIPVSAEETPKLEELLEALGRLPFNQRAALVMRELEGRSYAEIAETLGVSLAAVETLIFRARHTLRRDRSLLGVLGSVQLPPSLAGSVGGGGGAVTGGGVAVGSGLLAKAVLLVAAGVVAGSLGPVLGARIAGHAGRSVSPASPNVARSDTVRRAATVSAGLRALGGPIVVATRRGETVVVTGGTFTRTLRVRFERGGDLQGGTGAGAQGATAGDPVQGQAGSIATGVSVPSGAAAAPASASGLPAATTTTQVTDAVSDATTSVSAPTVSTPTVSTPTATVPPPPSLPIATPTVSVSLPATPTVP